MVVFQASTVQSPLRPSSAPQCLGRSFHPESALVGLKGHSSAFMGLLPSTGVTQTAHSLQDLCQAMVPSAAERLQFAKKNIYIYIYVYVCIHVYTYIRYIEGQS